MLKERKTENLISSSQDTQLQRSLGLLQQCCETRHGIKPVSPTRREAHDKAGLVSTKAKNIGWKGPSLKSLRKAGSLAKQLEPSGLDAMGEQSIASSILIRLPRILSLDASLTLASSSQMAGFKAIDDDGVSPTAVELRQHSSL
jgi:hypothetical protein